jgi:histidyl-tRNA synthetase
MRVQRCKGMGDLSPEEMEAFRFIEGAFRGTCLQWGYDEVRTPTLEYLHLFTSTGTLTPGMLNKVYSFLDWDGWSGERVVLRPDGTIFEETGKERRERWQCGAELIGAGSPAADIELLLIAVEILRSLGLKDIQVKLSHAGLIRAFLAELGLSPQEQARIFDQVLDGDAEALSTIKAGEPERGKALSLLLNQNGKSSGFLKNLGSLFNLPDLATPLNDFITTTELLTSLGYDYQIDIASGRGFEYYTGIIFHLSVGDEKVGGGGRYDALVPLMGGQDTPASGFALYLDHLMKLTKPKIQAKRSGQKVLVRTDAMQVELLKEGFNMAKRLHEAGYAAEVCLGGQETGDLAWTLDIQSKAPQFVLTDRVKQQIFEAQAAGEALRLLQENSADKDSAA